MTSQVVACCRGLQQRKEDTAHIDKDNVDAFAAYDGKGKSLFQLRSLWPLQCENLLLPLQERTSMKQKVDREQTFSKLAFLIRKSLE